MKNKIIIPVLYLVAFCGLFLFFESCEEPEKREPINFNPSVTYGSLTDVDGNVYKTLTIGSQTWMAQNLRTTRFNDNIRITHVVDSTAWGQLTTPAYCFYENDNYYLANIYGAFYNWYAVNTGKLCPSGWHVPSEQEWVELKNFLGGEEFAGGKMKETGVSHWQNPNVGATNESGFTALPSGGRGMVATGTAGQYEGRRTDCGWISSTKIGTEPSGLVYGLWINTNYPRIFRREFFQTDGVSVRCIKDQ